MPIHDSYARILFRAAFADDSNIDGLRDKLRSGEFYKTRLTAFNFRYRFEICYLGCWEIRSSRIGFLHQPTPVDLSQHIAYKIRPDVLILVQATVVLINGDKPLF